MTASVGNGRSEICWAVVTGDGRYAFTTNFADGAVSRYAIEADGASPSTTPPPASPWTAGSASATWPSPPTDDYLYALDADSGSIFGWAVGADGSLSALGSWDGLPATAAGLAAT